MSAIAATGRAEPVQDAAAGGARSSGLVRALAVCAALALASLLLPSSPTYDPYAWIVWGREVVQGDLVTTGGPSWKPLPVLFTAPFSLLGDDAAPLAWLVVTRTAVLFSLVLAFRLGERLSGARLGGWVAAIALAVTDDHFRNSAYGNSEGLLVVLGLLAVAAHVEGRHRASFLVLVAAGLLRPELWPLLAAYGVWYARLDARRWALVAGCGVLTLALWLVPEWIGSGDPLRASDRAREPNPGALTFEDRPALAVLERAVGIPAPPVYVLALVGLLASRRLDQRAWGTGLALGAAALMATVMLMTEAGYSGNLRYVALPIAFLCLLAGRGAVAIRDHLAGHARPLVVVGVLAVLALGGSYRQIGTLADDAQDLKRDAELETTADEALAAAGGRKAVDACGALITANFQVPLVAWVGHRHIKDVEIVADPPGTLLRPRASLLLRPDPRFASVPDPPERWDVGRACSG